MSLDRLTELASVDAYPDAAIEAAKVVLVHDFAVASTARELIADLLGPPSLASSGVVDLATGECVTIADAVSRNGQLIHALTQDDTLQHVMTHVGATSLPLLLALADQEDAAITDLVAGLAASFAAAEVIARPVAVGLAARGVRPTPVVGPIAAQVGAGRMLGWSEERVRGAISRATSAAFGTLQPAVEGSQEWLFQIDAAGGLALAAARSSAKRWVVAQDPLWGASGLFTCLGLQQSADDDRCVDGTVAATRASIKRFPACAVNQVALVLLQRLPRRAASARPIVAHLSEAEAAFPGIDRTTEVTSWSARLLSLQYCLAVMASEGTFAVEHLRSCPASVTARDLEGVQVLATSELPVGTYRLAVAGHAVLEGSTTSAGRPEREELAHAATSSIGKERVSELLGLIDRESTSVRHFTATAAAARPG